jgi:hypothetical protein
MTKQKISKQNQRILAASPWPVETPAGVTKQNCINYLIGQPGK